MPTPLPAPARRPPPPAPRTTVRPGARRWPVLLLPLLLAACAAQQRHDEGLALIGAGQPGPGLAALREASAMAPTDARWRTSLLSQRQRLTGEQLHRIDRALALARPDEARSALAQLAELDPQHERLRTLPQQIDAVARGMADLDEARRLAASAANAGDDGAALAAARRLAAQALAAPHRPAAAEDLLRELDARSARRELAQRQAREAASPLGRSVSLQLRDANLRAALEGLSRSTGLNIVIDNDVRRDLKVSLHVQDAPLGDVVDMLLLQNQLARRTINANSLLVYPATAAKLRDYQELSVRTFQVSNADIKQAANALRTLLKVRDLVVDERAGTIQLRDTPDTLAVAERMLRAQEQAEPEVMLEVEVLEVSRDRLSTLGLQFPTSIGVATPGTGSGSGGALTLGDLRQLGSNQLLVTPLALGLNLRLADTDANLLASPRIRTKQREKARVMIGDKVPVITNSVTPVQSGSAVVTGSVQYLDVGIKLEVEPEVHADGQVSIRMNLEVSNIAREIAGPAGSLAYQIGSRNAQTTLRLRDGETQVLAGLISDQARNTASKLPLLGQAPILGRLFSSDNGNSTKSEIVLSITPRIIRPLAALPDDLATIPSGTEAQVRARPLALDRLAAGADTVRLDLGRQPAAAVPAATPTDTPPVASPAAAIVPAGAPAALTGPAGAVADPAGGAQATATRRTRPAERIDVPPVPGP